MGETLQTVLVGLAGAAALGFLLWRWRRGTSTCETCHRSPAGSGKRPGCEEGAGQAQGGDEGRRGS